MSRILALALIVVPLAAGGAFSDFDQPKAVLLSVLGLGLAWRLLRDGAGGPALARSVVIPCLLGLGTLALGAVLARGADLIPVSGELARLGLAIDPGRGEPRRTHLAPGAPRRRRGRAGAPPRSAGPARVRPLPSRRPLPGG
ncbi:MAG: hypothetical protein R3F20_12505 [Planctomycetota bacterium]